MAELLSMETKRNNEKQKALDSALAQIERCLLYTSDAADE